MAEIARVLVPTGTVWLNLGDTYSTHPRQGAATKSLLLGPERLALALLGDGWTIRNKVIWAKTNPIPSSVGDRLATTHEVVYLLARNRSYYFDLDSIRQPAKTRPTPPPRRPTRLGKPSGIPKRWLGPNTDTDAGLVAMRRRGLTAHPLGKNPGDVWHLATARYRGDHFATYPEELVERMLLAGVPEKRCVDCRAPWYRPLRRHEHHAIRLPLRPSCTCTPEGDRGSEPGLVLDPFIGSGTTAVVARRHRRDWLGIEIHPDFAEWAETRITQATHRKEEP